MYLRRVEVHGFKSFADRQRFDFGPGVTAVVGPNGSGKSNVSDAIRWALGEQSARSLRARKTEDVIFSGSDRRRQLGMAEVTLVLDNTEQWMPVDFSEVTVTRRAYRSGESEYLINGQKVRLMDVHDLFRRAQVGQNSYAMMSQGLVDEVLALRPVERRDLIEEAADVHRHRIELNRAERRLTETRDNLGHVRMLIREVEPRLKQLERQSVRAERYKVLQAQLSDVLQVYYEHELRSAQDALTRARATHDQHARAFQAARTELDAMGGRTVAVDGRVNELRSTLERAQSSERALTEESLRLQQAVALAEQRLELLAARREEVEAELSAMPAIVEDGPDPEEEAAALEAAVGSSRTVLEREREALSSADEAARTLLRTLAESEARRIRLEAELKDTERRLAEHEGIAQRKAAERAAARERRQTAKLELREYGRRVLALDRERTQLTYGAQEARRRRDVAERQLEEQLRLAVEANDELRQATSRVQQLRERLDMLTAMSEQAFDANATARALLAAASETTAEGEPAVAGIIGIVSRLLRVPDGLDQAIEAALAEHLSAVVVETEADALAAIAHLRDAQAGAVTFFPLDRMPHVYPLNLFNERGVIGVAARLVRVDQRYRPLIDTLLGRVIVVDNIEVATKMVRRGLGSVVTRDGVLLRQGGSMYGGRAGAAADTFGLIRELETLPTEIEEAQLVEERARARLGRSQDAVEDARDAVASARKLVDEAEERRRLQEEARTKLRRDLGALAGQMRMTHAALRDDGAGHDAALEARERIGALRSALVAVAEEITTLRDRSEAVGAERDQAAARVTVAAQALAAAEGERESVRSRRAQRAEELRFARERRQQRLELLAAARRETEDIELSLRDLRGQVANNRTSLAAAEAAVGPAHAALAEALGEQRELGATRGDVQNRLFAAERDTLASDAALRQSAARLQTLHQQIVDEGLEVALDGSVRPVPPPPVEPTGEGQDADREAAAATALSVESVIIRAAGGADVDPDELRQRITELRGSIRNLGPVNIDALDDLSEERERHTFLTHQVSDLEAAEVELRSAIRELEKLIRTRFDETFAIVNANFQTYFERFFGGGTAELRIVEPDVEGGDAGVEIAAQPPGKRVASLSMLSGGERSMTSVALLFALLSVNPAPVCVMDEVDAALDEANVGRFVETLRELLGRSQFIIITHNRRTTEAADTIYGISMGEESTSQVLSLNLMDLPRAS